MLTAANPATAAGTRSDARDTFAGTRTFLAWNRPALVLIGGASQSPQEVFAALVEELRRLLSAGGTTMVRYEPDGTVSVVASSGECKAGSAVGTPIVVEGRLWGAMVVASRQAAPLPADAESRIEEFTS